MTKSNKKTWIIALCLTAFFSAFFGYYLSYRIHEKNKSKIEIIKEIMENEWYYGIDDKDISSTLESKIILSMQDLNKDPYTKYLPSLGTLADSYKGIGITLHVYADGYIISEVNSPYAIEAGVKVNDTLIAIDDTNVSDKSLDDIKGMTSNKESVKLTLKRDGNTFNVITPIKNYKPVTVFTKQYGNEVAYVKISEFNLDTADYIEDHFEKLEEDYTNTMDLILDLRGNPGGYIESVREVMDLFVLANRTVMSTVDKYGKVEVIKTKDSTVYSFEKIYILIDDESASGAEALAAAMDYHLNNVILYGETTYGKGSAQKTYTFEDGTYFHYTYALWKTPFNETINHKGVNPHPEYVDKNQGISSIDLCDVEYKKNDYGEGVKNIQLVLQKLGLYDGELHSFMDDATIDALKEFQNQYSLEETGKYDKNTMAMFAKLLYDDEVDFKQAQLDRVIALLN